MRYTALLSPVLMAIFACTLEKSETTETTSTEGGTTTGGTTTGGTTTTTAGTAEPTTTTLDPGTTTAGPTTSTSTGTTDPVTTGTASTGDTTGEPSTGTTDGTTGGTTGGVGEPEYGALFWSGGLDHVIVRKADKVADLCFSIGFAWPMDPPPGLTLPAMWGLQFAEVGQGAATCLDDLLATIPDAVAATLAEGAAGWDTEPFCPPVVDVDLTLTFPQDQPWVPAQDQLTAFQIPTQGC